MKKRIIKIIIKISKQKITTYQRKKIQKKIKKETIKNQKKSNIIIA
jgi:hypothetical protein